jgi:hypothetical protein
MRNQYYAIFGPSGDSHTAMVVKQCNDAGGKRALNFDPKLVRFVFVRILSAYD